ncbi:DUF2202 domain-containing protein [Marinomonas sp. THO17]|uniref:DUF2202 domain-containing protein n=1 Tax=Marinomonas sp. THO17 TaxID=3149048 RepID=UPI00336C2ED8
MTKYVICMAIAIIFAAFNVVNVVNASDRSFGADAAKQNKSPSIQQMLDYAIQDEYLARSEYELIMDKFGEQRPFSNIIRSEETHIKWLKEVYNNHSIPIPHDNSANHVELPKSLKDAFAIGVQAEIDNIAMYDSFLKNPLLEQADNDDIKSTFTKLMQASKNHLSAFEKGLSRHQ